MWDLTTFKSNANLEGRPAQALAVSGSWMISACYNMIEAWELKDPAHPTHWGEIGGHQD